MKAWVWHQGCLSIYSLPVSMNIFVINKWSAKYPRGDRRNGAPCWGRRRDCKPAVSNSYATRMQGGLNHPAPVGWRVRVTFRRVNGLAVFQIKHLVHPSHDRSDSDLNKNWLIFQEPALLQESWIMLLLSLQRCFGQIAVPGVTASMWSRMKLNKGCEISKKKKSEYIVKSGKENKAEVSQMPVKHISPFKLM